MAFFQSTKSEFGKILEDLAMESVDIFYGHLVYFGTLLYSIVICFFLYFGNWCVPRKI
jgi:hypothetical protein